MALGRDADNAIYPIAWAVVQVENKDNWLWFARKIKIDLGLNEGDGFIMVSDRQKVTSHIYFCFDNLLHYNYRFIRIFLVFVGVDCGC